jgi:glycosyltransferase involved in cell wall biosynthesis
LRDRTLLTGMLTGRAKLSALVDAHLLAQPSFHENFGMAVLEALACGCPVLVSDQVYLHPQISQGRVGGVTPCTVDAVAVELQRWLSDPKMRNAAAARARSFALTTFNWDEIGRNWAAHYQSLRAPTPHSAV